MKVNLQGTVDILEAARIFDLRRVTFLSSISVYMPTSTKREFLSEEDDLPAVSSEWIGGSKKAGEQICQLYAKQYGLSIPIVRPPQVWGPLYWTHRSPVHSMIENAIAGKPSDYHLWEARFAFCLCQGLRRRPSVWYTWLRLTNMVFTISEKTVV
jgi:nucleoside-diphosphate-sugar epimerase